MTSNHVCDRHYFKLHNTTNSSVGSWKDLWQKTSKFSKRCSLIARDRFLWFLWFHIHGWPFRPHVSLPLECCFSQPVSMYRSSREKTRRKEDHFGGCSPMMPKTGGCLSVTSDFSVCLCSAEVVRCRKKILYEKWPTTDWILKWIISLTILIHDSCDTVLLRGICISIVRIPLCSYIVFQIKKKGKGKLAL